MSIEDGTTFTKGFDSKKASPMPGEKTQRPMKNGFIEKGKGAGKDGGKGYKK